MTIKRHYLAALCGAALLAGGSAYGAEAAKSYQVTGPVTEVSASTITVQKGDEKWQIARTKDTKVSGTPKVGSTVTIHYVMTAKDVEVKDAKLTK